MDFEIDNSNNNIREYEPIAQNGSITALNICKELNNIVFVAKNSLLLAFDVLNDKEKDALIVFDDVIIQSIYSFEKDLNINLIVCGCNKIVVLTFIDDKFEIINALVLKRFLHIHAIIWNDYSESFFIGFATNMIYELSYDLKIKSIFEYKNAGTLYSMNFFMTDNDCIGLCGLSRGGLQVWKYSIIEEKELNNLPITGAVFNADFCHYDGKDITVACSDDWTIYIYVDSELISKMYGHKHRVYDVKIIRVDETSVIIGSVSQDGCFRMWKCDITTKSYKLLKTCALHKNSPIRHLDVCEKYVSTGGDDGCVTNLSLNTILKNADDLGMKEILNIKILNNECCDNVKKLLFTYAFNHAGKSYFCTSNGLIIDEDNAILCYTNFSITFASIVVLNDEKYIFIGGREGQFNIIHENTSIFEHVFNSRILMMWFHVNVTSIECYIKVPRNRGVWKVCVSDVDEIDQITFVETTHDVITVGFGQNRTIISTDNHRISGYSIDSGINCCTEEWKTNLLNTNIVDICYIEKEHYFQCLSDNNDVIRINEINGDILTQQNISQTIKTPKRLIFDQKYVCGLNSHDFILSTIEGVELYRIKLKSSKRILGIISFDNTLIVYHGSSKIEKLVLTVAQTFDKSFGIFSQENNKIEVLPNLGQIFHHFTIHDCLFLDKNTILTAGEDGKLYSYEISRPILKLKASNSIHIASIKTLKRIDDLLFSGGGKQTIIVHTIDSIDNSTMTFLSKLLHRRNFDCRVTSIECVYMNDSNYIVFFAMSDGSLSIFNFNRNSRFWHLLTSLSINSFFTKIKMIHNQDNTRFYLLGLDNGGIFTTFDLNDFFDEYFELLNKDSNIFSQKLKLRDMENGNQIPLLENFMLTIIDNVQAHAVGGFEFMIDFDDGLIFSTGDDHSINCSAIDFETGKLSLMNHRQISNCSIRSIFVDVLEKEIFVTNDCREVQILNYHLNLLKTIPICITLPQKIVKNEKFLIVAGNGCEIFSF
eukprot:TRINITY_DN2048_c0_g1_i1.p1 TRINITY_DN2048_c0_g1~~TRINITY_DN2048_c0_g1_i1.p1  ORF type:complete len:991 (-),score=283.34 TRINITY_DN2048_c0_g1_i1:52-3024(-)